MKSSIAPVLLLVAVLAGCNTSPMRVQSGASPVTRTLPSSDRSIVVLTPKVVHVDVKTEQAMSEDSLDTSETSHMLRAEIERALAAKGYRTLTTGGLSAGSRERAVASESHLRDRARVLTSYYKSKDELRSDLRALSDASGASTACLLLVTAKHGSGGGFDPVISGRIWQSLSTATFKAVFVSLTDGELIWANEVFMRDAPREEQLPGIVDMVFSENEEGTDR